ncbi:MAG: hypothetical protein ACOCY1_04130 [Halovenus sp.]
MTDTQTTLAEFEDDPDVVAEAESEDSPTAARNARDIEHLVDLVNGLTDQVETIASELEQQSTEHRAEDIDTHPQRMYQ